MNNKLAQMLRKRNGITLIALVITIIVLLILAGVVINTIIGNENVMEKAQQAKTGNDEANELETIKLAVVDAKVLGDNGLVSVENLKTALLKIPDTVSATEVNALGDEPWTVTGLVTGKKYTITSRGQVTVAGGTSVTSKLTDEEKRALAENGMEEETEDDLADDPNIKAVVSGRVPIPAGYTYVEGTSTALSSAPKSWGVVIQDEDKNQFVWVPVNAEESNAPSDVFEDITENNKMGKVVQGPQKDVVAEEKKMPEIAYAGKLNGMKLASINGLEGIKFGPKVADSGSGSGSGSSEISYTIYYYKDGNYYESEYKTASGEFYVDDDWINNNIDKYKYDYDGYEFDYVDNMYNTISDGNSIYVYYKKSSISYTINYYKDGNQVDSEERTADSDFCLNDDWINNNIDKNKYDGYEFYYVNEHGGYIYDGNSISVYYLSGEAKAATDTTVGTKTKGGILSEITRGNPTDTSSYREPALVTNYDLQEQYYTQAGFTSATQMAQAFKKDYEDMVASIKKYGGFYVGRYELSGSVESPTVQANQNVKNSTNWYQLYKACRGLGKENTTSTMMWGAQWDLMCLWSQKKGDTISYSQADRSRHTGSLAQAGKNSADKRNNIYDVEGNCCEWTQEAALTSSRAHRGGYYGGRRTGGDAAIHCSFNDPCGTYKLYSSRPSLYIK